MQLTQMAVMAILNIYLILIRRTELIYTLKKIKRKAMTMKNQKMKMKMRNQKKMMMMKSQKKTTVTRSRKRRMMTTKGNEQ